MPETAATALPVTAYASLSACGIGNAGFHGHLAANRSALGALTLFELPFAAMAAQISAPLPAIRPALAAYRCRNAQVALAALNHPADGLRAAVENAAARYGKRRVGVVIGTSTSGMLETEDAYAYLLQHGSMPADWHFLESHAYQATARFLQRELDLQGPCYAVSTACSSGTKALAAAQRLIAANVCDAVLAGGVDTLCRLTLRGFNSLELVSDQPCRPLDKQRQGINIGEAAGLLLLEKPRPEYAPFPHLLAVGESSDAYHMSSPQPDGDGAVLAMQRALHLAGLPPAAIDYINLHATATRFNDRMESRAVYRVFGATTPCSGTKGITGHTLGAAGALEAIAVLLALQHRFIPGTCGLQELDAENRCNVVRHPLQNRKLRTVMSNSFGFGGNNASVIFRAGNAS
ncbi:MAG: beta-ketoacyl-ACP synthase [Gammaproteobacteria bacterium]